MIPIESINNRNESRQDNKYRKKIKRKDYYHKQKKKLPNRQSHRMYKSPHGKRKSEIRITQK